MAENHGIMSRDAEDPANQPDDGGEPVEPSPVEGTWDFIEDAGDILDKCGLNWIMIAGNGAGVKLRSRMSKPAAMSAMAMLDSGELEGMLRELLEEELDRDGE